MHPGICATSRNYGDWYLQNLLQRIAERASNSCNTWIDRKAMKRFAVVSDNESRSSRGAI